MPSNTPKSAVSPTGTHTAQQAHTQPAQPNTQMGDSNFGEEIKSVDGKLKAMQATNAKASIQTKSEMLVSEMFTTDELIANLEFRPPIKIADFGCGQGNITLPLAGFVGESSEVYGIDVQKDLLIKMLRQAKERNLNNIKAVWGDLDKVGGSKMADNFFDMVIIVNTLFQLENKKAALQEAWRILKDGGKLIIVDWRKMERQIGPRQENTVNKNVMLDLAQDAGFLFVEIKELGRYHYMYKFTKH